MEEHIYICIDVASMEALPPLCPGHVQASLSASNDHVFVVILFSFEKDKLVYLLRLVSLE